MLYEHHFFDEYFNCVNIFHLSNTTIKKQLPNIKKHLKINVANTNLNKI